LIRPPPFGAAPRSSLPDRTFKKAFHTSTSPRHRRTYRVQRFESFIASPDGTGIAMRVDMNFSDDLSAREPEARAKEDRIGIEAQL
jgi:hypothetical protein